MVDAIKACTPFCDGSTKTIYRRQQVLAAQDRNLIFAGYDTRAIERYEGPPAGSEEVSLTSLTDKPK